MLCFQEGPYGHVFRRGRYWTDAPGERIVKFTGTSRGNVWRGERRFLGAWRRGWDMERAFNRTLFTSLGLVVALMLIGTGLGYWNTRRLNKSAAWTIHTHNVIESLESIVSTMKDAETGQRGYMIPASPTTSNLTTPLSPLFRMRSKS